MTESPEIHFTPEQELLLWSIRVDHAKDQRIEEILKAGVDWNYVRETAKQHGIIPLLYKRLKEDMGDLVTQEGLSKFRNLFMANAVHNIRMTQQLLKVLDLLADAGVEAMPFKGPAIAVQAYGDLSMRSFCDLDILIHEKNFDIVYILLTKNGYKPFIPIDSELKKKFIILQKDFSFSGHGIQLEVHWRIAERFLTIPLNMEQIWDQKKSIPLSNREILTFSPEDVLILLCIHGSLHFWQELKWISDLNYLIKGHSNFKWEEIIQRTENLGIKRIVTIGLFLSHEYGGIEFSSSIQKIFKSDVILFNLASKITQNFFLQTQILLTPPLYYLKLRERWRDQLNYGLRYITYEILIPNQYDFKFFSLPSSFFPFYFFLRSFRLFKEHIPELIMNKETKLHR